MAFTAAPRQRLIFEMVAALFLSTIYFWLVKDYAIGISNNTTNGEVFTSCSLTHFQLNGLFDVWKGRLSGMLLTGWMFDLLVNHGSGSYWQLCTVFGLYQSVWLFLLFLVVILSFRQALLINLGIFLGVTYNFFPICGLYFYPWDIPATLFFTLAVLLFHQRKISLMVTAICVGCFFKETVLICALLVLFIGEWKWWRRILVFAGIIAAYAIGKKLLLGGLNISAAALSMNDSKNLHDIVKTHILLENLQILFSANGLYVIFANAGTMITVLLLGWRRQFMPYMVLILAFLAGQAMYGAFLEFRIFMQILPLSLFILSARFGISKTDDLTANPWNIRSSLSMIPSLAIWLVCLSTVIVSWRYFTVYEKSEATDAGKKYLNSEAGLKNFETTSAWFQSGRSEAGVKLAGTMESQTEKEQLATVFDWYSRRYCSAEKNVADVLQNMGKDTEAIKHYQVALAIFPNDQTNLVTVNNNLAWIFATSAEPSLRNGTKAVRLAELACQATHRKEAILVGTLAAAYAEAGKFDDAITAANEARKLALDTGQSEIAAKNEELLKLYLAGKPYHQAAR